MNRVEKALARATETRALLIGSGVLPRVAELFNQQFPDARAVIIADPNTWQAAGATVEESLRQAGIPQEKPFIISSPDLYAEWRFIEQLENFLKTTDAIPVAVGSGTINDLTKLASHRTGRRYLCVGTAASMDGYTAYGASITYRGAKQTFDCPAPLAMLADTRIIAKAPAAMTASGYADLFAKITAGADWILADELGVEPIDPFSFSVVQEGLKEALADPEGARRGDEKAIEALVEGLILGGFAMQAARSSRPASGADHQFSHLWDMEHHKMANGIAPSHGFKVSIGMLASTALYEQLLATPVDTIDTAGCVAAWPSLQEQEERAATLFAGSDFPTIGVTEIRAKYIGPEQLRQQIEQLKSHWAVLHERLSHQLIPFEEAKRRLQAVGAPTRPEEIGITPKRFRESFLRAQHIRRRFTILDVAVRLDRLDKWVDSLLTSDRFR